MLRPQIHTIYCDDIIHDVNGKESYIGAYSTELIIPVFPAILPKLMIVLRVPYSEDDPIRAINISVLKDSDVLQVIDLNEEKLPRPKGISSTQLLIFEIVFSPLQLDAPCIIKVNVKLDEEEYEGQSLQILKAPTKQ
ncbi:MAG: hypothetical protein HOB14_07340 [Gammaproteobacteria bacterium]|nr:hypothetical protein [Gammaproteobacteria bacterium]